MAGLNQTLHIQHYKTDTSSHLLNEEQLILSPELLAFITSAVCHEQQYNCHFEIAFRYSQ